MRKLLALSLPLILCLCLTACVPATEDAPTPSTESPAELPPETTYEGVITEPPIIEPPLFLEGGEPPMIIAEVLEMSGESVVLWDIEFTKVNCRLVYGYKASLYRYSSRVSEQGEFALYLTDDALQQLGQAKMLLRCSPMHPMYPYEGYAADYVVPIADGRMVLEGEWWRNIGAGALSIINDQIQYLADKRVRGEELSETERLAPTSPLENGMMVEDLIAFLDTWEKYCVQASADFSACRAELYG